MKNFLLVAVTSLASLSAHAGFTHLTCSTYRISKDTNKNVQTFSVSEDMKLNVNGVELTEAEWVDGSLMGLSLKTPVTATYKSKDGKGDYLVRINALSKITSVDGRASIGRGHDVTVYKVRAFVSRNNKTHEFLGTCTEENMSSCGGACGDESDQRDEL